MAPSFAFIFLSVALFRGSYAGYSLTVEMKEFSNPDYKDLNGYCCDSYAFTTCQIVACDFKFRFCVEPMQDGTPDMTSCKTGWLDTGKVADNVATFHFEPKQYGVWCNPSMFIVTKPWEGFYFKIQALDDDKSQPAKPDDPIDNLLLTYNGSWAVEKQHDLTINHPRKKVGIRPKPGNTMTKFSFIVNCDVSSTGPHCTAPTTSTTTTIATTTSAQTTESTPTPTTTSPHTTPTTTSQTTTPTTTATGTTTKTTPTSTITTMTTTRTTATSKSTTLTTFPTTTTTPPKTTTVTLPPTGSITCAELRKQGQNASRIYEIQVEVAGGGVQRFKVYCDMDTDGGGWTVIQRQKSPNTLFNTTWAQYEQGFNDSTDLDENLWLGNQYINWLTQAEVMGLRVDFKDCHNEKSYAYYPKFEVGDASTKYQLRVSEEKDVIGDAGNSLSFPELHFNQNGAQFSAMDQDNDKLEGVACSTYFHGGWWFNACGVSNLNGFYYPLCAYTSAFYDGIFWFTWKSDQYSARTVEMKLRRADYHSL